MTFPTAFAAMLQAIGALLIFVAGYLALVLSTIFCLVMAELISERSSNVRLTNSKVLPYRNVRGVRCESAHAVQGTYPLTTLCSLSKLEQTAAFDVGNMGLPSQTGVTMEHQYDLFETLPDCSVKWHGCVRGTEFALAKLKGISKHTTNECFAILVGTQKILARANHGHHARVATA